MNDKAIKTTTPAEPGKEATVARRERQRAVRQELDARLQIRLSAEELAAWTEAAEADDRTVSAWIRRVVNQALGR